MDTNINEPTTTQGIPQDPASLSTQEAIEILVKNHFQKERVEEFLRLENSPVSYEDLLGLIKSQLFTKRFEQVQIQTSTSWWAKDGITSVPQLLAKITPLTISGLEEDLKKCLEDSQGSFKDLDAETIEQLSKNLPWLKKFFESRRIIV